MLSQLFSGYIPVLVYHRITPNNSTIKRSDSITVEHFERQLRFLYEQGYQCFSLSEYIQYSQQKINKKQKAFLITFDDGGVDFYNLAFPVLQKFGFSATMFLVMKYLENSNEEHDPRTLSWEQVDWLFKQGISFGSHTWTHPHLPSQPADHIRSELVKSKACLENRLGIEVLSIAYPYGESNKEVQKLVFETGYRVAFGVSRGEYSLSNLYLCSCGRYDNSLIFVFKLSPWYLYYLQLTNWIQEKTSFRKLFRYLKTKKNSQ